MGPSNNASCPQFIHSFTPLTSYFMPSSAEWRNRRTQNINCLHGSHHSYPHTDIYVHKLCLPHMNCPTLVNSQSLHPYPHWLPSRWYFSSNSSLSFLHMFSPLVVISNQHANLLLYSPSSELSPILKNIIHLSAHSSLATTLFLCPFVSKTPGNVCLYLVSPSSCLSLSFRALWPGHHPNHSTRIYVWPRHG